MCIRDRDNLVRRGVELMTDADHMIHVSGHPARDELRKLYKLVRPRVSVPVHGEWRHLSAHAALAKEAGITPILLEDGDVLSLAPGRAEVVDSAPVGRLVVDGNRLVPLQGGVMGARRRMLFNGVAVLSLAVDEAGRVRGTPRLAAPGLFEPDDPACNAILAELGQSLADLPGPIRRDDSALSDAAAAALRRALGKRLQKRPMVTVHLLRV